MPVDPQGVDLGRCYNTLKTCVGFVPDLPSEGPLATLNPWFPLVQDPRQIILARVQEDV